MAPSVILDNASDFQSTAATAHSNGTPPRILLLSPPSLSSHPEILDDIVAAHDRSATDIQMLDRLSLSLVHLPDTTYDIVLILLDADQTRTESSRLLTSSVLQLIVKSLKPGGTLTSQDGTLADTESSERSEAIFAGLVIENSNMVKPNYSATDSVPLRLGKQKADGGAMATTSPAGTGVVSLNLTGKRKNGPVEDSTAAPAGVGFDLPGDDLDGNDDDEDELINENDLLSDEDMKTTLIQRTPSPPLSSPFPVQIHSTNSHPPSPRMPPQNRQAPPRLQRLYLRPRRPPRSRRRSQTQHRRSTARETQSRRTLRGRFYCARESGQLWELRAGRCVSV